MNQSVKRILFTTLAGILLLTACTTAAAPAPTQDPAQVQSQIAQAVALTVAAQDAQTAAQQAAVPSNTPLPTQTESAPPTPTPLIPTATPFVIVPPTLVPSGGGGGGSTNVKPGFACDIIHQRPFDDTIFKPNDPFDVKWTIVNTGTKTWRAGLDLKYLSGPKMTSTANIQLPEMKPGDQFNVVLDAIAPADKGTQVMVWVIEGPICYPYVRIIVDK